MWRLADSLLGDMRETTVRQHCSISSGSYALARVAMVIATCFVTKTTCSSGPVLDKKTLEQRQGTFLSPVDEQYEIRLREEGLQSLAMRPVSRSYFSQKVEEADSYHDVMRIFYGEEVSDDVIDDMLTSQYSPPMQSKLRSRTRLGMSDTMAYSSVLSLQEDMDKALRHSHSMDLQTTCQRPVPRTVHIRDITRVPNKDYFPKCTVVYECSRQTGCCDDNSSCEPKTVTEITRPFFVLNSVTEGGLSPDRDFVQYFTFENHTECECRQQRPLPQCLPCPRLFQLRWVKATLECQCDCQNNGNRRSQCQKIKRGQKPYEFESQLECMKNKTCGIPKCEYGEFIIHEARCPRQKNDEENLSEISGGTSAIRNLDGKDNF